MCVLGCDNGCTDTEDQKKQNRQPNDKELLPRELAFASSQRLDMARVLVANLSFEPVELAEIVIQVVLVERRKLQGRRANASWSRLLWHAYASAFLKVRHCSIETLEKPVRCRKIFV